MLVGFQLDQRLQHQLHRLAHEVDVAAGAQRVEQLGQGRLVEGHRGVLLRDPWSEHAEDHTVAPPQWWTLRETGLSDRLRAAQRPPVVPEVRALHPNSTTQGGTYR